MKEYASVFKALSDETRLQILVLILHEGEMCVCDVMHVCAITQSKASRHLRYLLHAGLVRERREGTWMYYSVPADLPAPAQWAVDALRGLLPALWSTSMQQAVDAWKERKKLQNACTAFPVKQVQRSQEEQSWP